LARGKNQMVAAFKATIKILQKFYKTFKHVIANPE
jgi:hypothetical protein